MSDRARRRARRDRQRSCSSCATYALPSEGLYPLRTLAAAGIIYGLASVAHGSGFLAVFIAGLTLGDLDIPYKRRDPALPHRAGEPRRDRRLRRPRPDGERLASSSTTASGSTGSCSRSCSPSSLARLALAPLLAPMRLRLGEKVFIAWGGLKGAVPILLAAFCILAERGRCATRSTRSSSSSCSSP